MSKPPKVLITGASGLLGRKILEEVKKQSFTPIGLAFSRVSEKLTKCDLTVPDEVENIIEETKPDYIVHAAAERSPDNVELHFDAAQLLNVHTSRRLAQIAKKVGSKIIYISSDYVFDGSSPPYKVTDTPTPLNKYGMTKYEGEKAILEENEDACILRIPVLYGPVEKLDESAVTTLIKCVLDSKEKSVSDYEKRYPSHTQDIARIICSLIHFSQKGGSIKGTFQWSGKERMTKYDMIKIMAQAFSLPYNHIIPDSKPSSGAPRPFDSEMDTSRLENLGISFHTNFADGIKASLGPWIDDCGKLIDN